MFFRKSFEWPELDNKEIRKISQILIIDDNEFAYVRLLEKDEFNITKWNDVDDLNKISDSYFDLILLDINGVGRELSSEEGFGVLKYLKENNPTQLIIAFSNADWSLKYQEFFKMADSTLSKDKDYVLFKKEIERLLRFRYSKDYYYQIILEKVSDKDTKKNIIKIIDKSITKKDKNILKKYLESKNVDIEDIKMIIGIFEVCLNIFKIILQASLA